MTSDVSGLALTHRLERRSLLGALDSVCAAYSVTRSEILGSRRFPYITQARHFFWLQLRERGFSFPEIGRLVHRDHTTVMTALRKLGK